MKKLYLKIKREVEFLKTDVRSYEEKTNFKISSYKTTISQFNQVTEHQSGIEKITHKFEEKYSILYKEVEYLKNRLKWYYDFEKSYPVLLEEFNRRVKFEQNVEQNVRSFKEKLGKKLENEIKERNKFKEKALRYFPPSLQPLLFELPIKYEIFPTIQKTAISILYEQDKQVFDRILKK